MTLYAETLSTCHSCGNDIPGKYFETGHGIILTVYCKECGERSEVVETNAELFKTSYEHRGYAPMSYLILPVTYRCNLKCKFCYTHSNYSHSIPQDRNMVELAELVRQSGCPIVNLAGGEPTVRKDLPQLLTALKSDTQAERLCVVTNGQRTIDTEYLKSLRAAGMDFLFLPIYVPGYDEDSNVLSNVVLSLQNAHRVGIPTWIQATIERLEQIDYVLRTIEKYRRVIFNITIRAAAPYGVLNPEKRVHVSDILRYLGKDDDYSMGNHPFNKHVMLFGRKTKISSWVNDRLMLDPYDARYVLHSGEILPFHKGMIHDDIFFKSVRAHC